MSTVAVGNIGLALASSDVIPEELKVTNDAIINRIQFKTSVMDYIYVCKCLHPTVA